MSSGVIGALTFAATDSFWFNAVEAEVYALSMFFTAAVVWLIMKWSDQARQEEKLLSGNKHHPFRLDANRYLVLIAYLFGLAIGVHLLNLLAMFFIALVIFFTEFDRTEWTTTQRWKGIVLTGVISAIAFFTIYPGIIIGLPSLAGQSGTPLFVLFSVVALVTYAVYYTHSRGMPAANIVAMCFAVVLIGYSSYALIFIRSQAEPPIDLMDPDTDASFVSYLKREQYGSTPLLRGVTFDNQTGRVNPQGEEALFPRRYSTSPQHWRVYERYDSDLSFFFDYQIGHMYMRYFLWNFAGRASDVQDAPAVTGIPGIDPASEATVQQTPSEEASHNVYFALPLLLGLLGAFFHFSYDWRRAFSVFILFFVTGIGIIIYLNQTPMQPRERDYSYVASFFAFSLWVGIGAAGLLQLAYESLQDRLSSGRALHGSVIGLAAALFLAVPTWMIGQNYDDHDRSGNYVARDYAHNMLMSLDENAILFTNGDNDTYPLWYLQSVENVRPDVRVVNLSLLNTPWYTEQLKEEQALASEPLPISMTDDRINNLGYIRWQPRTVQLPVNENQIPEPSEMFVATNDTTQLESPMSWELTGRPFGQDFNVLQGADQVAYNILRTNAENGWQRPVYFAITVAPSGQLDLQNYFQLEGLTFRVVPIRHNQQMGRVVPEIASERLDRFRFTNLNDPDVYFNENTRRMLDAYRNIFSHTAERLAAKGQAEDGEELIERLMAAMPFDTISGDARSRILMARAFEAVGDSSRVVDLMEEAEPLVFGDLRDASTRRSFSFALQYAGMVRMMYQQAGAQESLSAFDNQLETLLAQAPYQLPPDARSAFGLRQSAQDSAAGNTGLPPALQPDVPR
jgi:MFS family permease